MKTSLDVNLNSKKGQRYLIPETTYDYNHPHVIQYTQYFTDRASQKNVFENIEKALKNNINTTSAEKIGNAWYEFSKYVPSFITKAVSLVTDPDQQHHLIQVAYDELGGRDKNIIHSKLFIEALQMINIKLKENTTTSLSSIKNTLSSLNATLESIKSESGIIGLLLSFEIIAEHNIETLFHGLCFNNECKDRLSESLFFKIHRADEVEHIRHSVANFLRFSKSEQEIEHAEEAFDDGVNFWKNFWDKMAQLINAESAEQLA